VRGLLDQHERGGQTRQSQTERSRAGTSVPCKKAETSSTTDSGIEMFSIMFNPRKSPVFELV